MIFFAIYESFPIEFIKNLCYYNNIELGTKEEKTMNKNQVNEYHNTKNVVVTLVNKSEKVVDLAKKYSCCKKTQRTDKTITRG